MKKLSFLFILNFLHAVNLLKRKNFAKSWFLKSEFSVEHTFKCILLSTCYFPSDDNIIKITVKGMYNISVLNWTDRTPVLCMKRVISLNTRLFICIVKFIWSMDTTNLKLLLRLNIPNRGVRTKSWMWMVPSNDRHANIFYLFTG